MLGLHGLDAVAQVRGGRRRRLVAAAELGGGVRFSRQAGIEDDVDLRTIAPCPLRQRETVVRTGKPGVGEQDVDFRAVLKRGFGFLTSGRFDDAKAAVAQILRDGDTKKDIVFRHQYRGADIANLCRWHQ